jgi:hypothetical protein
MNETQIAADLRHVLEQVDGMPANDVENITVLISVGEWKIALETICTQIYECDLEIRVSVREELIRLGRALQTPAAYLLGDPWADPNERGDSPPE